MGRSAYLESSYEMLQGIRERMKAAGIHIWLKKNGGISWSLENNVQSNLDWMYMGRKKETDTLILCVCLFIIYRIVLYSLL